jgi:hypothetical protein
MPQFKRACREFDKFIQTIDESIKLQDKSVCKACGKFPFAAHIDGNMTLYRYVLSKGYSAALS